VGEQQYLDELSQAGWEAVWITILEENATFHPLVLEDAATWASTYDLDPAHVLFDPEQSWVAEGVPNGYPMVYAVHSSNMLIWAGYVGWWYTEHELWQTFSGWWQEVLGYAAAQPGAIAQ
jgi:hypothetical protein